LERNDILRGKIFIYDLYQTSGDMDLVAAFLERRLASQSGTFLIRAIKIDSDLILEKRNGTRKLSIK
jgi:hypothetical protein